jgi:hypothetical protein
MNPTDADDSRETAGSEAGTHPASDELDIPETHEPSGFAGDAESGDLSDDVESGGP